MTWNVVAFNVGERPGDLAALDRIEPRSMGDPDQVRARISEVWPEVRWNSEGEGFCADDWFSCWITLLHGPDKQVPAVVFKLAGRGDPLPTLARVAARNGWQLVQASGETWVDLQNPSRDEWQAYQQSASVTAPRSQDEKIQELKGCLKEQLLLLFVPLLLIPFLGLCGVCVDMALRGPRNDLDVWGTVLDSDRKPLAGATVEIYGSRGRLLAGPAVTSDTGQYALRGGVDGWSGNSTGRVVVKKEGYQTTTKNIDHRIYYELRVILLRDDEPPAE